MAKHGAIVHSNPEILGGTPVFVGTRVPLRNLIDYLEGGYSLDELLDAFPSERKANSKVTQNSRAAYRDASGGVPEGTFSKSTTPTFHFSYRIHP